MKRYCYSYAGQIGACPASTPTIAATGSPCHDMYYGGGGGITGGFPDSKCVNGQLETQIGNEHYTSSIFDPNTGQYVCTYHYVFSDGVHSWDVKKLSESSCMPTVSCSASNCPGPANACINGQCEAGMKVYDGSTPDDANGNWVCTYHYEFSDGSQSGQYAETSSNSCTGRFSQCRLTCTEPFYKCFRGICERGIFIGLSATSDTMFYCYEWSDGSISPTYSAPLGPEPKP